MKKKILCMMFILASAMTISAQTLKVLGVPVAQKFSKTVETFRQKGFEYLEERKSEQGYIREYRTQYDGEVIILMVKTDPEKKNVFAIDINALSYSRTDANRKMDKARSYLLRKYNLKNIKQVDGGTKYVIGDYVYILFSEAVRKERGNTYYLTAVSFNDQSLIAEDFLKGLRDMMLGN